MIVAINVFYVFDAYDVFDQPDAMCLVVHN